MSKRKSHKGTDYVYMHLSNPVTVSFLLHSEFLTVTWTRNLVTATGVELFYISDKTSCVILISHTSHCPVWFDISLPLSVRLLSDKFANHLHHCVVYRLSQRKLLEKYLQIAQKLKVLYKRKTKVRLKLNKNHIWVRVRTSCMIRNDVLCV